MLHLVKNPGITSDPRNFLAANPQYNTAGPYVLLPQGIIEMQKSSIYVLNTSLEELVTTNEKYVHTWRDEDVPYLS